jgi:DNA polymerase-3 subunit alpha
VAESILATRAKGGPFTSLHDLCARCEYKVLNRRVIEALIKSGAFDSTGYPRKQLYHIMEEDGILEQSAKRQREREAGQLSMFDLLSPEEQGFGQNTPEASGEEWNKSLKLAFEREMLGMYLSDHPLSDYEEILRQSTDINLAAEIPNYFEGRFGGMLSSVEVRPNKEGKMYARGQLEDMGAAVKFVVFSHTVDKLRPLLEDDKLVLVDGRFKQEEGEATLIVNDMHELVASTKETDPRLVINTTSAGLSDEVLVRDFRQALAQYPGRSLVELRIYEPHTASTTVAVLPEQVNPDGEGFLNRLTTLFGVQAVTLTA